MLRTTRRLKRWTSWLGVVCLVLGRLTSSAAAQAASDVAVVVHPDVPVDNLTVSELRRVVLGEREFWPAGVRITLLIRAPVAHERDIVLKNLCQMTEAQFRQHWIGKVFRADTALAPKIVYSTEMAAEMVNRFPGAIAFIDASLVTKGLKVVKIDGRLAGEKGYVLR
jgi:ABC-type phosphate transport system substrate-binding protein